MENQTLQIIVNGTEQYFFSLQKPKSCDTHTSKHTHASSIRDWVTYRTFNTGLCTNETNSKVPPKNYKAISSINSRNQWKSSYVTPEKYNWSWGEDGEEKLQGTE